jgi:hypothetical protein
MIPKCCEVNGVFLHES